MRAGRKFDYEKSKLEQETMKPERCRGVIQKPESYAPKNAVEPQRHKKERTKAETPVDVIHSAAALVAPFSLQLVFTVSSVSQWFDSNCRT